MRPKGYTKNWVEQKMNRKKDKFKKKHLYGQCMFKMSEN